MAGHICETFKCSWGHDQQFLEPKAFTSAIYGIKCSVDGNMFLPGVGAGPYCVIGREQHYIVKEKYQGFSQPRVFRFCLDAIEQDLVVVGQSVYAFVSQAPHAFAHHPHHVQYFIGGQEISLKQDMLTTR